MHFCMSEVERMDEIHLSETMEMPQIGQKCGQIAAIQNVHAEIDVAAEDEKCHAEGDILGEVIYICSRCLTTYPEKLVVSLDESFTTKEEAHDGAHLVSGDVVNLNPFIEQELFLGIEYRPLCSEECKGLCPECGCNRNEQVCSCNTEKIDPRLSVLKDLHLDADSE